MSQSIRVSPKMAMLRWNSCQIAAVPEGKCLVRWTASKPQSAAHPTGSGSFPQSAQMAGFPAFWMASTAGRKERRNSARLVIVSPYPCRMTAQTPSVSAADCQADGSAGSRATTCIPSGSNSGSDAGNLEKSSATTSRPQREAVSIRVRANASASRQRVSPRRQTSCSASDLSQVYSNPTARPGSRCARTRRNSR